MSEKKRLKVYLAGPEVFLRNALEFGHQKKSLCAKYGFEGVFPIDTELDISNKSPREAGLLISATNERLIETCDLLIANLTPFRGPSADVGTSYELGFARGLGKKIFAYTNTSIPFTQRTLYETGLPATVSAQRCADKNDMAIEQWGFIDNLMLDGGVLNSGGFLIVDDAPIDQRFTYLGAFEKCLFQARTLLLNVK
ncbi:nucleoside 2-deoxyribosyltransferase [Candidatus Bathycorpusculum sp.]|uniref:nucleoside 2-deoxyribosyltransferase n=1 Tax=Candidatus Bathycorpusculum sp. TaxID=2994959 RepID=UPI0028344959|nr:nucleoside 2-deoxyribosyltransferase [Candidatus Termitimicrobium sp.]